MKTVTVIYKSGAKVQIKCKSFGVKKNGSSLREVEWESPKPRPMLFGIDEVAAIYEGEA